MRTFQVKTKWFHWNIFLDLRVRKAFKWLTYIAAASKASKERVMFTPENVWRTLKCCTLCFLFDAFSFLFVLLSLHIITTERLLEIRLRWRATCQEGVRWSSCFCKMYISLLVETYNKFLINLTSSVRTEEYFAFDLLLKRSQAKYSSVRTSRSVNK